MPGGVLGVSQTLSHIIIIIAMQCKNYYRHTFSG